MDLILFLAFLKPSVQYSAAMSDLFPQLQEYHSINIQVTWDWEEQIFIVIFSFIRRWRWCPHLLVNVSFHER